MDIQHFSVHLFIIINFYYAYTYIISVIGHPAF